MFKKKHGRKISNLNMNTHKSVIIPDRICQNSKSFSLTFYPRNTCKMDFSKHLWLPFLGQPQSDVVVFEIIYSDIYRKSCNIMEV